MSRALLSVTFALLGAAFLIWIGLFKVVDSDFWWHIKAGEVMWQTKSMIMTDPFAYTREGLPYLARHEWLSQIAFYAVNTLGGATGIILLRIFCLLLTACCLLLIDRKNVWPNILLVVAASIFMRQGFIERPQIFTNIFFVVALLTGLRLLDDEDARRRRWLYGVLIVNQILWVNMHGAAALLSLVILTAVFSQQCLDHCTVQKLRPIVFCGIALLVAMLISPNFHHNFTYVWLLMTDQTKEFIREWAPTPFLSYLVTIGPFWIIAFGTLVWTRRKWLPIAIILLTFGILSRLGSRHEVLFLIAALGCTFYELKWNARWNDLLRKWTVPLAGVSILIVLFFFHMNAPYRAFLLRNNFVGFGSFEPAKGAVDFVEENGMERKIFNNYGIGGYLIYRGKKVFLDGRNVDYGYDYLNEALQTRYSHETFKHLETQYGFSVAIIEFESTKEAAKPFDFAFLDDDPIWRLVYVDDWASVYVKNTPVDAYNFITPENLDRGTILEGLNAGTAPLIEEELKRVMMHDARGINGLLALAKLYRSTGRFEEALPLLDEAMKRSPHRFEPYEVRASILAATGNWEGAGLLYEKVIALTKYEGVEPNYAHLAEVFERAGDAKKAQKYRRKITENKALP